MLGLWIEYCDPHLNHDDNCKSASIIYCSIMYKHCLTRVEVGVFQSKHPGYSFDCIFAHFEVFVQNCMHRIHDYAIQCKFTPCVSSVLHNLCLNTGNVALRMTALHL
jgi:hypothetical protein